MPVRNDEVKANIERLIQAVSIRRRPESGTSNGLVWGGVAAGRGTSR
jgi:hypothetical protein